MTDITREEMRSLGTKGIAKRIRSELKTEFPGSKFSVRTEYFSGGSSITVALMKADRKIKMDFDSIPEMVLSRYLSRNHSPYSRDDLRKAQGKDYHQLGESAFYHYQKYDDHWNNGAFLTYQGYTYLKRVCQIVEAYHRVDSDIQTDYYNTNFYFHLQLGKWDKAFMDGEGFKTDTDLAQRVESRDSELKELYEKAATEKAETDRVESLERDSHVEKSRRTVAEIKSIMRATAIIGANGFEVMTQEAKAKKILELDEVKQALKTRGGIDWVKEIFEL